MRFINWKLLILVALVVAAFVYKDRLIDFFDRSQLEQEEYDQSHYEQGVPEGSGDEPKPRQRVDEMEGTGRINRMPR